MGDTGNECPACGREVGGHRFCPFCGTPARRERETKAEDKAAIKETDVLRVGEQETLVGLGGGPAAGTGPTGLQPPLEAQAQPPLPGLVPPGPARAPSHRATWITASIIAALLVVGIVVTVVMLTRGGGEVTTGGGGKTSGDTASGDKTTDGTGGFVSADLASYVTSVTASSTLVSETPGVSYAPGNMIDGNPQTGWAEGVPGYGEGEHFDFTFRDPVVLKEVRAIPGYKRFYKVDRYIQNGKLNQVTLTFDDGSTKLITFRLDPDWQAASWQTVPLDPPVRTRAVRVTIVSVYPGQDSGRGPATDTTVSEFCFNGFPSRGQAP